VVLSSISLRAVLGVIELALACRSLRIHWRHRALDAALGLPTLGDRVACRCACAVCNADGAASFRSGPHCRNGVTGRGWLMPPTHGQLVRGIESNGRVPCRRNASSIDGARRKNPGAWPGFVLDASSGRSVRFASSGSTETGLLGSVTGKAYRTQPTATAVDVQNR
jgi:hypothetical protein